MQGAHGPEDGLEVGAGAQQSRNGGLGLAAGGGGEVLGGEAQVQALHQVAMSQQLGAVGHGEALGQPALDALQPGQLIDVVVAEVALAAPGPDGRDDIFPVAQVLGADADVGGCLADLEPLAVSHGLPPLVVIRALRGPRSRRDIQSRLLRPAWLRPLQF